MRTHKVTVTGVSFPGSCPWNEYIHIYKITETSDPLTKKVNSAGVRDRVIVQRSFTSTLWSL